MRSKWAEKVRNNTRFKFPVDMSKVGSLDNINHTPKGGDKKIFDEKVKVNASPKVKSLEVNAY